MTSDRLPAPTEDQLRLARAVLNPLAAEERRAVYAVVAYETVRELEGERDVLIEDAAREVVKAWDAMPSKLADFPGVYEWSAATLRLREALALMDTTPRADPGISLEGAAGYSGVPSSEGERDG